MNERTNFRANVGVDIGRVVMCPTDDALGPDTSFLRGSFEEAMAVEPSPGAETTLLALSRATGGRVWFVSKAGERIEKLTRAWFHYHRFFERTEIPEHHLHFCRKREDKRPIAERLGLTHFIDDRRDVLGYMRGAVPNLYLFGAQEAPAPPWATHVMSWAEVSRELLARGLIDA